MVWEAGTGQGLWCGRQEELLLLVVAPHVLDVCAQAAPTDLQGWTLDALVCMR